jgi:hypothetical protein
MGSAIPDLVDDRSQILAVALEDRKAIKGRLARAVVTIPIVDDHSETWRQRAGQIAPNATIPGIAVTKDQGRTRPETLAIQVTTAMTTEEFTRHRRGADDE